MEHIKELESMDLGFLEEQIAIYNGDVYPKEHFTKTLKFFNEVRNEYVRSIFNSTVHYRKSIYKAFFDNIKNKMQTKTKFSDFSEFDSRITFGNHVISVLHIVSKSHLLVNPNIKITVRKSQSPFQINVLTPENPNSERIKSYIENSKNNLATFYRTINGQIKFSRKVFNEIINNKQHTRDEIKRSEHIMVRCSLYNKWLIRKQFESFEINIVDEMCITSGKPGIYGSVNFTLRDKSCIIFYPNGTCLMVSSKRMPVSTNIILSFIYKVVFGITFLTQLLIRYLETDGQHLLYKPRCCDHNKNYCPSCFRFMRINYPKETKKLKDRIEFTHEYYQAYPKLKQDYEFLTDMLDSITNVSNTSEENQQLVADQALDRLEDYALNGGGDILQFYHIVIFGLKNLEKVDVVPYMHLPPSHKKLVCMFTGMRITYRSLKTSIDAMFVLAYYRKIIKRLKEYRSLVDQNIFTMSKERLKTIIDKICNGDD